MKNILILVLWLFTLSISAQVDLMSTTPNGFVNDYEELFSPTEELALNQKIKSYKDKTSIEICVVTTDQIFNSEAELKDFSDRLGEKWGVGSSELDNGIIVVISLASRKWSISSGYGVEALYTDMMSRRLAERHLKPNFRNKEYAKGVDEFLNATFGEIGFEGFEQLIEKEQIREAEQSKKAKEFGMTLLYIFIGLGIIALFVFMIKIIIKRRKAYNELNDKIDILHEDIIKRKEELLKILGKMPTHLTEMYDNMVTHNDVKVDADTYNRLYGVREDLREHQSLIRTTNSVINNILVEEKEITKYLNNNYDYCEEFLKDDLKSFSPDTTSKLFTSVEFTLDRLNKLRNINNSLSGKLKVFLKKTYTISAIVSASNDLDSKIEELNNSYDEYKKGKKLLLTLPIGKRLLSLSKVDIESYISDVAENNKKSKAFLDNNDYKSANYHNGVYLTTLSVLTSSFSSVSNLISSYKNGENYIKRHKGDIESKTDDVESKIKKSGVKSSRKRSLGEIEARTKSFNNNIAFDVILAAALLKSIIDELDSLYSSIKRDIRNKKDEDERDERRRRNSAYSSSSSSYGSSSSSSSSFGGFGGGSFGGGGSSGSFFLETNSNINRYY